MFHMLADQGGLFNLFNYLTFRTGGAVITALIICFLTGPRIINWLKTKQKKGQPIREDGPQSHIVAKAGTPTMGGFMILLGLFVSTLLWADLTNPYVWAVLAVTLSFGAIGFVDDYLKVTKASSDGVPGRLKFIIELAIGLVVAWWMAGLVEPTLALPFFKTLLINLGIFYLPFACLVIVWAGNAVNLTDGLDGLAIVPVMIAAAAFGLIAYLVGNTVYTGYLGIAYVAGAGELSILWAPLLAQVSVFCGSTRRPQWSSWETQVRWRLVAPSGQLQ